jgi:hypothetical protein
MSKIYLSAAFSRRTEMAGIAYKLRFMGHEIVSRWVSEDQSSLLCVALMDMSDLKKADTVIVFADSCYFTDAETLTRRLLSCARMSELGVAIAYGKRLIVVGSKQNVFCEIAKLL